MKEDKALPDTGNSILKVILYSNIFAVISFATANAITNWDSDIGRILSFSEFVLVPVGMGIIAMKFWVVLNKRLVALLPFAIANTLIGISLSALFMGEGIICLIIVSPLVLVFMWRGIILGKYIYVNGNTTLKTSTFLIFIFLFVYDTFSKHDYTNTVSDEIIINAPRNIVWKYVAEHPVNTNESEYWLFEIGLPSPVYSTVTSVTIGGKRKCVFSNGTVFDEIIMESSRDSLFTFNILKQPEDPEIIGHIEIQRGQFILRENPNGTTTLIGNSWYKLKVYLVWYYDLWAVDITRNVHIRVMKHIKDLAENDV